MFSEPPRFVAWFLSFGNLSLSPWLFGSLFYVFFFFFFFNSFLYFSLGTFWWSFSKLTDSFLWHVESVKALIKGALPFMLQYFLFLVFPFDSVLGFLCLSISIHLFFYVAYFFHYSSWHISQMFFSFPVWWFLYLYRIWVWCWLFLSFQTVISFLLFVESYTLDQRIWDK